MAAHLLLLKVQAPRVLRVAKLTSQLLPVWQRGRLLPPAAWSQQLGLPPQPEHVLDGIAVEWFMNHDTF